MILMRRQQRIVELPSFGILCSACAKNVPVFYVNEKPEITLRLALHPHLLPVT